VTDGPFECKIVFDKEEHTLAGLFFICLTDLFVAIGLFDHFAILVTLLGL
jgi:hypothetical protein